MAKSNYNKMAEDARKIFLSYDQAQIIDFHKLSHDDASMRLKYLNGVCDINRADATLAITKKDGQPREVTTDDVMAIYDYLCYSLKEPAKPVMSGAWASVSDLGGVIGSYHQESLKRSAVTELFTGNLELLQKACEEIGGEKFAGSGDVSVVIPIFEEVSVVFQFWDADDEFPSNYQFMFDRQILKLMHYETVWYLMNIVEKNLIAYAKK